MSKRAWMAVSGAVAATALTAVLIPDLVFDSTTDPLSMETASAPAMPTAATAAKRAERMRRSPPPYGDSVKPRDRWFHYQRAYPRKDIPIGARLSALEHVAIHPTNPDVAYVAFSGFNVTTPGAPGHIFKTTDAGATWTDVSGSLPDNPVNSIAIRPDSPEELYIATDVGVFISLDGGGSWAKMGNGIPNAGVAAVAVNRTTNVIAAATFGRSVWTTQIDDVIMPPGRCTPDATTLCIDDVPGDQRFKVTMAFDTTLGGGQMGNGLATSLASVGITDGGIFAFRNRANPEMLVKVLNFCQQFGSYGVFVAAATTVGYELRVEDTIGEQFTIFRNPDRNPAATITRTDVFSTCTAMPGTTPAPAVDVSRTIADFEAQAQGLGIEMEKASLDREKGMGGSCTPDATTLCIDDVAGDRRFKVTMTFDTTLGGGQSGDGLATSLEPLGITDGGIFAFRNRANPEMLVKVLNFCQQFGSYGVFVAAATTVGFDLRVEDTIGMASFTLRTMDRTPAPTVTRVDVFSTCPMP